MIARSIPRASSLLLAAVLLGGLPLASAPAHAQAGPAPAVRQPPAPRREPIGLTFSLDLYGLRRFDEAYDLWESRDEWSAGGFEVGYDAVRLGESTRLALALGWMTEEQEGRPPGGDVFSPYWNSRSPARGQLESRSLQLAATVRWRTDRALQPYVGLAVGGTRSDLTLDPFQPEIVRSRAYGLLGKASLGLRVQPARLRLRRANGAPLFALGLGVEVGALAGTPLEHEATAQATSFGPAQADAIAVQKVSLGSLAPTGAYARLAIVVGF